jgi:NAD(P)-dependent dehydrogenase (short-subunit alcohol dehydrogenase family)
MSKTVFLTGASGGLGRALAQVLCANGHRVAGLGRRADALEETRALCGAGFVPLVCDVADAAAVRDAAARAAEAQGPAEVLINNAAVYPRRDTLDETPETFAATLNVNLGGMVNAVHAVLPGMVDAGRGRILTVGSYADIAPLPASSAYSVSKGATRILTRALIADLGDRFPRIVIGDWMPGMLATEMGVPEGLAPEVAAGWGAALALWDDPSLTGTIFEMDREIPPPRGLKGRVKDLVTFSRPPARRIAPLQPAKPSQ